METFRGRPCFGAMEGTLPLAVPCIFRGPCAGRKNTDRCAKNSSLLPPLAAVGIFAPGLGRGFSARGNNKAQDAKASWALLVRWKGLEPPAY